MVKIDEGSSCNRGVAHTILVITTWSIIVIYPLSITLGIIGNIFLFLTMRMPLYSELSFSTFFKFIAIMDIMMLLLNIPRWLQTVKIIHIKNLTNCKIFMPIVSFLIILSNWLLFAANLDRVLNIVKPTLKSKHLNKKGAKIISGSLIILDILLILFLELTMSRNPDHNSGLLCTAIAAPKKWISYVLALTLYFLGMIAPFIGIVICSIYLYITVIQSKARAGVMLDEGMKRSIQMLIIISIYNIVAALPIIATTICDHLFVDEGSGCTSQSISTFACIISIHIMMSIYWLKFYTLLIQSKENRKEIVAYFMRKR
ncbi:hypothetical protein ACOME3_001093 [Neoechinorhynchus agilis]